MKCFRGGIISYERQFASDIQARGRAFQHLVRARHEINATFQG